MISYGNPERMTLYKQPILIGCSGRRGGRKMVFDLYFPLFAILIAYLIVGGIASVTAGILLGALLDRLEDLRVSIRQRKGSSLDIGQSATSVS